MTTNIPLKLSGRYLLVVRDAKTLEVKREIDWFDNLITEIGLNRIGTGGVGDNCRVGSGSTPATVDDTTLASWVANTTQIFSHVQGNATTAPYYGWCRRTYRFPAGAAAGNLSEVGIGWGAGGGNPVFSRALIRDTDGNPTTITVLSDEVLDVVYELRNYAPTDDVSFNVTIAGVVYAFVMRPSSVTANWATTGILDYGTATPVQAYDAYVMEGPIGTVTQNPAGATYSANSSVAPQTYVNNSKERAFVSTWALDAGNVPGGIGAFWLTRTYETFGSFQMSITPKMVKDNTKVLSITFKISWARKT